MGNSSISDASTCNFTCSISANNTCAINKTSCYIEKQCYEVYQTRLNGSVSCIQYQPKKIQTQWIFNPHCSASNVSDYFKKRQDTSHLKEQIQLHIHLNQAKLRNVTRFNSKRNEEFTGRIAAGKLTALMGGSGCGKSSLLETIHGRRQLRKNGYITFAEHKPLIVDAKPCFMFIMDNKMTV